MQPNDEIAVLSEDYTSDEVLYERQRAEERQTIEALQAKCEALEKERHVLKAELDVIDDYLRLNGLSQVARLKLEPKNYDF